MKKYALLLPVMAAAVLLFSGCGVEKDSYPLEISLEKQFDAAQAELDILPWLTTMDEAWEILGIDSLPEDGYLLEDRSGAKYLMVYNTKLDEFRYPMEMNLMFRDDLPVGAGEYRLSNYSFFLYEADGISTLWYTFGTEKQLEIAESWEEDVHDWLESGSERYGETLGSENYFAEVLEDDRVIPAIQVLLPDEGNPVLCKIRIRTYGLMFSLWD